MKRLIAKWYLSKCHDNGTKLPNWIRTWVNADPTLREFERMTESISQRLRQDAVRSVGSIRPTSDSNQVVPRRISPIAVVSPPLDHSWDYRPLLATAAILVACLVGSRFLIPSGATKLADRDPATGMTDVGSPLVAHDPQPEPRLALREAFSQGKRLWRQVQGGGPSPSTGQALPQIALAIDIVRPAAAAGQAVGRTLVVLQEGMQSEREQLNHVTRRSFDYFARELPTSALALAGWRSL